MALTDKLTAIGNAIRAKTGGTDLIPLADMPAAIESIPSGGSVELCELTIGVHYVQSSEFIVITYDDMPYYGGTMNAEYITLFQNSTVITNAVKGTAIRLKYNGDMVTVTPEGLEFVGTLDGYSLYKILDNTASFWASGRANRELISDTEALHIITGEEPT